MFSFADQGKLASSMFEMAQNQSAMNAFSNSLPGQMMASQVSSQLGEGAKIFQAELDAARAKKDVLFDKLDKATTDAQRKRYQSQLDDLTSDISVWTRARDRILVGKS